ncbi:MAG: hypothetical protein KGJ62_02055 [Armatimonadetes bacterium]|nr:hypothetical protein [Armatimonadota bacterium]MDE2206087.1 hypothetical protein [Armatimonadota bacterium]
METQFKRNDKNYIVGAVNKAAHWGYQTWHREIDKEVVDWILAHPDAPANELRTLLREIYSRPGVSWRFPGYKVP